MHRRDIQTIYPAGASPSPPPAGKVSEMLETSYYFISCFNLDTRKSFIFISNPLSRKGEGAYKMIKQRFAAENATEQASEDLTCVSEPSHHYDLRTSTEEEHLAPFCHSRGHCFFNLHCLQLLCVISHCQTIRQGHMEVQCVCSQNNPECTCFA